MSHQGAVGAQARPAWWARVLPAAAQVTHRRPAIVRSGTVATT